jgi:hypothetical protein
LSTGLTNAFVGGAVQKTVVSGAVLSAVQGTANNGDDTIKEIKLTFATDVNIVGRTVTLTTNGTGVAGTGTVPNGFTCQTVQASVYTSLCTAVRDGVANDGHFTGITSLTAAVL